jgi:hypothetical protein
MAALFKHRRSARGQAIHVATVSIAFVAACFFGMEQLGNIKEQELMIIYGVIAVVFIGLWAFLVIPNFLNKDGALEVYIDRDAFKMTMPDGRAYDVATSNIKAVRKVIYTSSSNNHVEYWVDLKQGDPIRIHADYGLSPHLVRKALIKACPDLELTKDVNY